MKNYHAQAKALRQQVAELDELIGHPIYCSKPGDEPKADRLWQEHVELLKLVYPNPDSRDHIQVTILDMYRDDALVLVTSFVDMNAYHQAYDLLGWDYDLVSAQIDICECCDEHYLLKNRVEDQEGRGFCKRGCFLEEQFERRYEADDREYEQFHDYVFPIEALSRREIPSWV